MRKVAVEEATIFFIQQLLGRSSVNSSLQYAYLSSSFLHPVVDRN